MWVCVCVEVAKLILKFIGKCNCQGILKHNEWDLLYLYMHFITSSSKQLYEVDYHPLFTDEESKAQTEEVTAKM